jgi:hypothetical protein
MGSTEISTIGQGSRQTIITLHLPPQDRNVVSCGVYGTTGTKIAHVEVHYRTGKVHGLFMGIIGRILFFFIGHNRKYDPF